MPTPDSQLLSLIAQYLPDNTSEDITPAMLRDVLVALVQAKVNQDQLSAFAQLASPVFTGAPTVPTAAPGTNTDQVASTAFVLATLASNGQGLSALVLPQSVLAGHWYLTASGIWEARRNFSASADPVNGANWLLKAGFAGQASTITAAAITDASDAGRRMLTAASADAQRALLNNPHIAPNQYGVHPGWTSEDGPQGLWQWVIKSILAVQGVKAPAAPTAGQVDDTADTFSYLPNPDYPSFAQYKVAGLPGVTGAVVLDATNSYVSGNRIYIKVVGPVNKGGLAVYVAGSGNVPDGAPLTNADPFTGTAVVLAKGYGATYTATYPSAA
ncbi:hypothetical protein GO988_11415 [Hymenobacter sp. HMF4947]|uniref:Uncharacterized protein n=1 Tax=Hymenobacter ginkgonis TaxID=2682976 RepID=A0A7K1TEU5_9BACT|nr:hypothetical protein [Hymenobacter ginkgonis]MVN76933.1 hypothetical protein [Hymenobacter ginkgonis]